MQEDELGGDGLFACHTILLRILHDEVAPEALNADGRLTVFVVALYGTTKFGGKITTANVTLGSHWLFLSLHRTYPNFNWLGQVL
jgi:hypothetical protein